MSSLTSVEDIMRAESHSQKQPAETECVRPVAADGPVTRFDRDAASLIDALRRTAMRLTGNAEDTEDLTQETMVRAYAGFDTFRDGTNVKAWLYRILRNTWISQYRARQCRPTILSVAAITDQLLAGETCRPRSLPVASRAA